MRKIPTLFVRDEDTNRRFVKNELTEGCDWVLAGEGRATRKYDGTCVLIRRDGMVVHAFARREVKPGKAAPPNFVEVELDDVTGKTVGWEPAQQSSFAKLIDEAIAGDEAPGTYELCGPKVNGNPEGFDTHVLVPHGVVVCDNAPRDFDGLAAYLALHSFEGIVWHHPDGRMAKLKKRDYPARGSTEGPQPPNEEKP